ncbi:gypsy-16 si [Solea senegalensis]|uniref:Gypsy-16 si n=1 Tax=Solea senegalensis TaxID=28829 RepID=A0AAV6RXC8_SOLSE|nr:gypsy-16 si [Solea senegalensis]
MSLARNQTLPTPTFSSTLICVYCSQVQLELSHSLFCLCYVRRIRHGIFTGFNLLYEKCHIIFSNAYLSAVKDKLLLEDDVTLERAQTIACRVEDAVKSATLLSSANRTVPTAPVQAVRAKNFRGKREVRQAKPSGAAFDRRAQPNSSQQQRKYFRCGSNRHLANDKNCPAASVKCNNCSKMGHYLKVCKSAVSEVREVEVPELTVLCVDNAKLAVAAQDKITCTVHIEAPEGNDHALELTVVLVLLFLFYQRLCTSSILQIVLSVNPD